MGEVKLDTQSRCQKNAAEVLECAILVNYSAQKTTSATQVRDLKNTVVLTRSTRQRGGSCMRVRLPLPESLDSLM